MNTFEFYQDQKVTAWDRIRFRITASDLDEAISKLAAYKNKAVESDESLGITITNIEAQYETSEAMTVEENGGCSTLEIFTASGQDVMDNTPEPDLKGLLHCSQCGSSSVQVKAWVNPNDGNKYISECEDTNDYWCDSCEQHSSIIPHSELMEDIEFWWQNLDNGEDREIITGLVAEDYDPSNDYQSFDEACNEVWTAKTDEEKIAIWKTLTQREDNNDEY